MSQLAAFIAREDERRVRGYRTAGNDDVLRRLVAEYLAETTQIGQVIITAVTR